MSKRFDWQPTQEEVAAIVAELRPVITAMARRQATALHAISPDYPVAV